MSRWCNAYTSLIWCHLYFLWSKSHSNWKPLSVQLLNCSVLFLLTTVTSAQNQHYADLLMCYVCKFLIFFSFHIFIESTWFFHFKSHTTFAWYSWFFTIQFIILFLFLFISLLPALGHANCKKRSKNCWKMLSLH